MVAIPGAFPAAEACDALSTSGRQDFFLPSYAQTIAINGWLLKHGRGDETWHLGDGRSHPGVRYAMAFQSPSGSLWYTWFEGGGPGGASAVLQTDELALRVRCVRQEPVN